MRKDAGLTQEELAEQSGIGPRSLQRYESGKRKITLEAFWQLVVICKFSRLAPMLRKELGPSSQQQPTKEVNSKMQVGQQNASIAAYNQPNVNVGNTGQQSASISAIDATKPNDATTASTAPQESTVVTISDAAQALTDEVMQIGNGTGKPPLDPP